MKIQQAIKEIRAKLNDPKFYDYSSLAGQLRDFPEVMKDATLDTQAYVLDHSDYGCSKQDIEWLLQGIEAKLK